MIDDDEAYALDVILLSSSGELKRWEGKEKSSIKVARENPGV